MTERYEPESEFLRSVIAEEVPLSGSEFAMANFYRLIAMCADAERSNRDWAVLLLSQENIDTAAVRTALIAATDDEDQYVRAEAVRGLAMRDTSIALPLVKREFERENACAGTFEAAALVAHSSLVELLEPYSQPCGDAFLDQLSIDALKACRSQIPTCPEFQSI